MESGKFVLRMDPKTHSELKAEARRNHESLNSHCLRRLKLASLTKSKIPGIDEIIREFQPLGVLLFGSVARGEETPSSDIDLLIVLSKGASLDRKTYDRWDSLNLPAKLSPQFVHLPDISDEFGSIWLENALEGEILFERDSLVKNVLRQIRLQIAEGKYLRRQSHGQNYWIRQPGERSAK